MFFIQRIALLLSLTLVGACGVNIFSPVDSPSGDAQLLSAARACLDSGDVACALDFYNRLSSSDTKFAENAFALLNQQGATFGAFLTSVGSTASTAALGRMANQLVSGSGSARRKAIFTAYKKNESITDATQKNFVKFLTSFSLASAILAETAGADSKVTAGDLTANSSSCSTLAASTACTAVNHGGSFAVCAGGSSLLLDTPTAAIDLDTTTEAIVGADLTLTLLNAAIAEISAALQALGSGGSFGSFSTSSATLTAIAIATLPNCFRAELAKQNAVPAQ